MWWILTRAHFSSLQIVWQKNLGLLLSQEQILFLRINIWSIKHTPITRICKKHKLSSGDNMLIFLGADLAGIQLMSKHNKRIRFLLCVINDNSKYAWVLPSKNKIIIAITNVFQKILDESSHKSSKISLDQGIELYNIYESLLHGNGI